MKYLRSLKNLNAHSDELQELQKDPFYSFCSAPEYVFLENGMSLDDVSGCSGHCRTCLSP